MIDASLIFDGTLNPVAGVAVTATRVSTNVIDWLTGRDMGAGDILGVHVQILETFATCTSLAVSLEVCDTAGGSYLALLTTPVIPLAQLVAGTGIFRYSFPLNQVLNAVAGVLKVPGQYVRLRYTVAGSDATAGKVFSYITPVLDRNELYIYPENYVTH